MFKMIFLLFGLGVGFGGGVYWAHHNPDAAAKFSFYLSTPIVAGAASNQVLHIVKAGVTGEQMPPLVIGIVTSGVVGYAAIAFLLRYLQTHNTFLFVYYRIALGIVVLLAFLSGFR